MLLSTWFLMALAAATGATLSWSLSFEVARLRRRRQPSSASTATKRRVLARRVAGFVTVAVLLCATIADGLNRHYAYIPSWSALVGNVSPDLHRANVGVMAEESAAAPEPTRGLDEEVTVPAAAAGIRQRSAYVYLPASYFDPARPARRFPVLYLLHGSPGVAVDWIRGGYVDRAMDTLAQHGAIEPFIVVMPDVNGGYLHDLECQDVSRGPQVQTFLVQDLVDWVDTHYRTIADRSARAIGGLSTGGYCGINLLFRHQDVYSAAVSHSGYGKPDVNRYTGDLFGGNRRLQRENTPDDYLASLPITAPLAVYLDAGAGDGPSRRAGNRLYDLLSLRQVPVTYDLVRDESHDFSAWRKNLYLSLPWLSAWFSGRQAGSGRFEIPAPDGPPTAIAGDRRV